MPLFKWNGINLEGKCCKGISFAVSQDDLDNRLLKQQIALISCSKKYVWLRRSVSQSIKIQFFNELSLLLKTGILLPEALYILETQLNQITLQEAVQQLQAQVVKGVLLHHVMEEYPDIFDPFMIQMVHVGHENGNLSQSLKVLSDYLEAKQDFHKKLRSLALAPVSTLVFFFLISFIIFVFIIPQFASIFAAAGKELPLSTQMLFGLADWMQSLYMPLVILLLALSGLLIYRWFKSKRARYIKARFFCAFPFIGPLVRYNSVAHFFQAVSLLLAGGRPLVSALNITQESLDNVLLADMCTLIEEDIRAGTTFSQALFALNSPFFEQDTILMIAIGQESGHLDHVLNRVSDGYRQKVQRGFSIISTLFQPMLLIILGLLVALLVFSVYIPLFNLSHVMPGE